MAKNVHTSYNRERSQWQNKREGASRVSGYYDTAREASSHGKDIARKSEAEWIKHSKANGQIQERNTYGRDPFPPKG